MKGALLDYIRAKVGEAIQSASNIIYTNPPSLTDLPDNGLVTKAMLVGYVPPSTIVTVPKTLTTSDPDIYTLTSDELDILNAYPRYPNFMSVVLASGQQFFDIYPIYSPADAGPGDWTGISVQLHSDGAGNNAEDTYIQFS